MEEKGRKYYLGRQRKVGQEKAKQLILVQNGRGRYIAMVIAPKKKGD
jgi:hypothetical protein